MHLQTLKLEGQVGVNSSIFTLPISKTKNSNNNELKTVQSHMKIILKYHKKGDKNSNIFIDIGCPVRIQHRYPGKIEVSLCHWSCP